MKKVAGNVTELPPIEPSTTKSQQAAVGIRAIVRELCVDEAAALWRRDVVDVGVPEGL